MAHVEWSNNAVSGLDRLVLTHSLPADTRDRVKRSVQALERFPRIGPEIAKLDDRSELRFLVGPWSWLVIVYLYIESESRIVVVSVEDGRAATPTVTSRRPRFR